MTGRASFLRRVRVMEAAHMGRVEEAKRAQLRAALEALPRDVLRSFLEEGQTLQRPEAWAAFLEEARAFYAGRGGEVADLEGAARWAGRCKRAAKGQTFPTPDPAHAVRLEAHAARLLEDLEGAKTEEARRFLRYSAACCRLRAGLARVLLGAA